MGDQDIDEVELTLRREGARLGPLRKARVRAGTKATGVVAVPAAMLAPGAEATLAAPEGDTTALVAGGAAGGVGGVAVVGRWIKARLHIHTRQQGTNLGSSCCTYAQRAVL